MKHTNTQSNVRNKEGAFSSQQKEEMLRKKAYDLYEKRGCQSGHELEDWLEAEKIV